MQGSIAEVKLDLAREGARPLPMMMNAIRRERDGVVVHELAVSIAEDRHTYERELMTARKRAEGLLADLGAEGVPGLDKLHVPAGHDLGGKGPGEIALSVVAEIVAEAHGRPGGPLRDPGR